MKITFRQAGIISAVAVTIAAGTIITVLAARGEGPALTGWMAKFTPAASPAEPPAHSFVDAEGKRFTTASFRGKVVLVNFWATWCGPCIREMPSFLRLQRALADEKFVMVALSEDRSGWKLIEPFLKRHGLEGLNVFHDPASNTLRTWDVRGLPTTVLFGKDGKEVGRLQGATEWDSPEAIALILHYMKS